MQTTLKKRLLTFAVTGLFTSGALAFTPTAAQIAQFKQLPKAQQEALAAQYGVDISVLTGATSATEAKQESPEQPVRANKAPVAQKEIQYTADTRSSAGLKPFGYDVLAGEPMDFTPVDNLPVPLDYTMAPGDQIEVQLYGKTNEEYSLVVDREGNVNFPEFGPVAVAGQTFGEMRQQLISLVEQKVIGVDVVVSMGAMRTMQVYIVGESQRPGAYNVNGLTSVTQALIASGGIKQTGSLRNIQLKRNGKVISTLDMYDLLVKGDSSGDIRLLAGDTLFIPTKTSSVSIGGEVLRPAIYELDNRTTISELLGLAGGLLPQAYLSKVSVQRATLDGVRQLTLDLTKGQDRRFVVKSGDKVSIDRASENLKDAVALRGEVVRQGTLSFTPGMKVSDVITSVDNDLKPSADLQYALIIREVNEQHDIEVLQFNLGRALSHPESTDNLTLQERDQIFVFDNGLDTGYWYGNYRYSKGSVKAKAAKKPVQENATHVDGETGAVISENKAVTVLENKQDTKSTEELVKVTSRQELLKPIVERLKAQATLDNPAKLIEISGAVKFPGVYPLARDKDIEKVIEAAGGLSENAYLTQAEITRRIRTEESFHVTQIPFSLNKVMKGMVEVDIHPQDNIAIKTQPNWQQDMSIELQGEVVFPGRYTFQRGETLQDIIERAGGLTKYAYPQGAVLSRERLKRQEQERLKLLNMQLKQEIASLALRRQTSSATYTTQPTEALEVANKLTTAEAIGRLVINLPQALEGDKISNVMLEKGDKLYIPALNPTVSIMGEVQFASYHTFRPEMTVEDYLASAGGTKKQADTDRIYVVRADGSVMLPNNSYWFSRKQKPLQPGDTIIVPIDTDYLDGLSTMSTATQMLYQIGVAWDAVKD